MNTMLVQLLLLPYACLIHKGRIVLLGLGIKQRLLLSTDMLWEGNAALTKAATSGFLQAAAASD